MQGVIGYFDKKDIPGKNNFFPEEVLGSVVEEVFCSGKVKYYHQVVGLIVAESEEIARDAARTVLVNFEKGAKPLLTVPEILADPEKSKTKIKQTDIHERTRSGANKKTEVRGTFYIDTQHHFHMETQICNVIPIEDGYDVISSTQWMDHVHVAVAQVLNIQTNKINISVRRLGGAFGAKIARGTLCACACAVAAHKLQKPVKMNMSLSDNLQIIGGRNPLFMRYNASVDDKGVMQILDAEYYSDYGSGGNEGLTSTVWTSFSEKYDLSTWKVSKNDAFTDSASASYCRAPGTTEGLAAVEAIMEHISIESGLSGYDVRTANFNKDHNLMVKFYKDFQGWADIDKRKAEIDNFNKVKNYVHAKTVKSGRFP